MCIDLKEVSQVLGWLVVVFLAVIVWYNAGCVSRQCEMRHYLSHLLYI